MKLKLFFGITMISALATTAFGANNCTFMMFGGTMKLTANCTTDSTILTPASGAPLDLGGFTITAVDPSGGHFVGGVIQNGGPFAFVSNGTIQAQNLANVCDAGTQRLRGVLFAGASGAMRNLKVVNINQNPAPGVLSGCQEGNALEARNFGDSPVRNSVVIDGNLVVGYQKTGIVANGNVEATITGNTVVGAGPQPNIAQNGIQIGFGATGDAKFNKVSGNAYSGFGGAASGGILVPCGPFYASDYCVDVKIMNNEVHGNDIGVYLSQLDLAGNAPSVPTNAKVVNNTITNNNGLTNTLPYQAGVSDVGNGDKIIANKVSGSGYNAANPCNCMFEVDADASFTNRAKVHANK